jgi:deoxycytidylate deaminase
MVGRVAGKSAKAHKNRLSKRRSTFRIKPLKTPYEAHAEMRPEIVLGIVGPLGSDNDKICSMLSERLGDFGYSSEIIKISKVIIPALAGPQNIPTSSKYARAKALIDLGNKLRRESGNAVLAVAAAVEIARRRKKYGDEIRPVAYIVSSLKHPREVAELRNIYGCGFFLFAVHSDREHRLRKLVGPSGNDMSASKAQSLVTRDEHETQGYGQHTRDTFHLADFFIADEKNDDKLRYSIRRCLDLVFGNPTTTPTFNEFAMFMAFAASLHSADLSRQVGAVVAKGNEILSTGANDCPRAGGGLYWPEFIGDRVDDLPRGRDYKRGCDSNNAEKALLIEEIVRQFPLTQQRRVAKVLGASGIKNITEYGRSVHAEMEALLACARNSVSCAGATIYCTTLPCHNCAKHIVAAGIKQVIYVEPYPKSKAADLHDDAITLEKAEESDKRVRFKPFIGVGPRQFFDLFSMSLSSGQLIERKSDGGMVLPWTEKGASPRMRMLAASHRKFEELGAVYLKNLGR